MIFSSISLADIFIIVGVLVVIGLFGAAIYDATYGEGDDE